jgi:hypothetical protein
VKALLEYAQEQQDGVAPEEAVFLQILIEQVAYPTSM